MARSQAARAEREKVQLRGGARRQPARRSRSTLSRRSRAPTKQMGLYPPACGVGEVGFGEALLPQQAGVAEAARAPVGLGRIAGPGEGEVDAEVAAAPDDLGLGERDQRGVDAEATAAFDAGLGREVGEVLEGGDVLGAAVGVAAE